jgi:5-methylcytosine-specific restriction enzyme B
MFNFFKRVSTVTKEKEHSDADEIRKYAKNHFITPARQRGDKTVTFSASDIHSGMKENTLMASVCSAIDSKKFFDFARVELEKRTGPKDGPAAKWVFRI